MKSFRSKNCIRYNYNIITYAFCKFTGRQDHTEVSKLTLGFRQVPGSNPGRTGDARRARKCHHSMTECNETNDGKL